MVLALKDEQELCQQTIGLPIDTSRQREWRHERVRGDWKTVLHWVAGAKSRYGGIEGGRAHVFKDLKHEAKKLGLFSVSQHFPKNLL